MGLMHSALGSTLADFFTGKLTAEATLKAVEDKYVTAAKEAGSSSEDRDQARRPCGGGPPTARGNRNRQPMRTRTFAAFVAPSMAMMVLFIALPLASVFWQSFHNTRVVYRDEVVEKCTPGFPMPRCEKETRSTPVPGPDGRPLRETVYVGLDNYRTLLRTSEVSRLMGEGIAGLKAILAIDFYRALRFTLTFTFITLPLMLAVGLGLALALNATIQRLRGPIIFVSLLPFIITPVIGRCRSSGSSPGMG